VGGGAAGIRCSLDLAGAGYKVSLVERQVQLGGHMSKLDKAFPYNKCAVCTLTPKMKEVMQNPAIEVLTNAELTALEGEAGAFTARIARHPRYVDPVACTVCGDCVVACPVAFPNEFNDGIGTRKAIGKPYQHAIPNVMAVVKNGHSPCKLACAVHTSAQGYIDLIAAGRYADAYAIASEPNPFPAVCGRICDRACEDACARGDVDEPIAIAELKRFVADWAADHVPLPDPPPVKYDERVAVIGAGPAGLTAARELAMLGYRTTVFEAAPEAGGMLRYGIPGFRLPKASLAQDVARISALGVQIETGQRAGVDFTIDEHLQTGGYDAVLVAAGAQGQDLPQLPGGDRRGVVGALDLLRDVAAGGEPVVGARVVVIGGGDDAFDAARSCRRLGAETVVVACAEDEDHVPAGAGQLAAAAAEQIEVLHGRVPVAVLGGAAVTGVRLADLASRDGGAHGGATSTGSADDLVVACDTLVLSGPRRVVADFAEGSASLSLEDSRLTGDEHTMMTTREGVFSAGAAPTAITAIAAGRRAARSIHNYLRGEQLVRLDDDVLPEARPDAAAIAATPVARRVAAAPPSAEAAGLTWDEAEPGYSAEQAVAEAKRCLDCAVCGECMACVDACRPDALRHDARDQTVEREVGAVVVAVGFDSRDQRRPAEYGFGRYANVVSSLGYERLTSPNGPTLGALKRPSDGARPTRIAFVQPVDPNDPAYETCTRLCELYATKEAMLAPGRVDGARCDVFSIAQTRPVGKGFEGFHRRAAENGVRHITAQPSSIREDPATADLLVHWHDGEGRRHVERYDMVVLAVALRPAPDTAELAATLGIALDDEGFCATRELAPVDTSRPGVYAAGVFTGPKDVPRSMAQASAAAARVMMDLAAGRGSALPAAKSPPPERDVRGEPLRMGVFVCRCDSERPSPVDVTEVARVAATLDDVVYVQTVDYACRADGIAAMREAIAAQKLNRVVVAGCSPRTKEAAIQGALRQAGLNPFLLEIANIREQVAWAHGGQPREATAKANDLVRMAAARARLLEPLGRRDVPFGHTALVIGGGVAGMTAALAIAAQGHPVHLIERSRRLGGQALDAAASEASRLAAGHARDLARQVTEHVAVTVHLGSELTDFRGFAGNFRSTLREENGQATTVEHGVVVVATGAPDPTAAPRQSAAALAALLDVPLDDDGFFRVSDRDLSPDVNLRPVDFVREGLYLCGAAEYPKSLGETITQAYAAAARAAEVLGTAARKAGGSVSEVDQDVCVACLTCVRVCPVGVPVIDPEAKKAFIEPAICKGCGICVSQCPVKAITLHHYTDAQIIATEEALFTEVN
jgi:heterodisulfide reductase subunit A-like polyferredoxin